MQKKLLIITACMLAAVVIAGIVVTNRNAEKKRQIEQIIQEDEQEEEQDMLLVSLETVREEADILIEEGRNGAYRNLQFNEIRPLITEEDRIYRIRVSIPEPGLPMTEEHAQRIYDTIQAFFDYPIEEEKITAIPIGGVVDSVSISELREKIREQNEEYTGLDYVFLYLENGEEAQRAQVIGLGVYSLLVDLGEPYPGEILDKVYYPGAEDGSLQDVYETADGEMSVQEAIEQVENYFNNAFPVSLSGGMKYRVSRVFPATMPDGTSGFDVELRRSYGGVLFQGDVRRREGTGDEVYDLTDAVLTGENHVSDFGGLSCNDQVEEIQEIMEIVSLKKAAEYISQKIGDQTVYTVLEIELAYVGNRIEEEGGWFEEMSPAWIFITTNQTNGREVRFYVDALTGEVRSIKIDP